MPSSVGFWLPLDIAETARTAHKPHMKSAPNERSSTFPSFLRARGETNSGTIAKGSNSESESSSVWAI
jgi:hypothetical protein